jgi:hypothetical protein
MTDYLDGALAARDRARLEEHLAGCPHCTEYLAHLRDVIRAGGVVEPDELPPETVIDETTLEQFMGQVVGHMTGGALCFGIWVGDELGLYAALAEDGPLTAEGLAAATGSMFMDIDKITAAFRGRRGTGLGRPPPLPVLGHGVVLPHGLPGRAARLDRGARRRGRQARPCSRWPTPRATPARSTWSASSSPEVGLGLGAQAGEDRLREVAEKAGFTRFRRAAETPLNLVLEVRP